MPVKEPVTERPVTSDHVLEEVLERGNLQTALKRVIRNGGSPGVDSMTVDALPGYLREHWKSIKSALFSGDYRPAPVKRVEIPKAGGGTRKLGVPTALDRFLQQALHQVLQGYWDPAFSDASYGFRPGRSAHQAVRRAQAIIRSGRRWVVDVDLEKFFDRVNHDKLLGEIRKRLGDRRVIVLIRHFLEAGVLEGGLVTPSTMGTPQGGPLSPLLSNLMLDGLDRELERRGHCFVRYADDCNVYVKSRRAGERAMASLTRFLDRRLKLRVNREKSAVARPWDRKFLGFTFSRRDAKRKVSSAAVTRLKARVRVLTRRIRSASLAHIIQDLRAYLRGWRAYFGICEVRSMLRELDSWIKRRLRCLLWKQWGRRGYRELRLRGVSRDLAWNTTKSAHGPWRLSRSPALAFALPARHFAALGLPSLRGRN
jgi:RNA-directed DNA polymerase